MRKIKDLTPKEVLALAIRVEQANGLRLRNFAHAFEGYDTEAMDRFNELAIEEDLHEKWLREKFKKMFIGPVPEADEFGVEEVIEAVEWDDSEYQIFDSLKAEKIYKLAMDAENAASAFYAKAQKSVKDKSLAKLFGELADMEKDHSGWLVQRIMGASDKTVGKKKGGKS